MVDFVQLQQHIKKQLTQDRAIHLMEAEGETLEAAVSEASTLLNVPVKRLEYEITDRGFPGFLGTGKKKWKIRAYERFRVQKEAEEEIVEAEEVEEQAPVIADVDGDIFVHLTPEGAFLKVTAPAGKGKRVSENSAIRDLSMRSIKDINLQLINNIVKEAAGAYVRVGSFDLKPANDAFASVEISSDETKASLILTAPGPGGCDLSMETMVNVLHNNRVTFGINEEFLRVLADKPVYNELIVVAEGTLPIMGKDAYLQRNYESDQSGLRLKEGVNGRVDFKDLNIIQNVVEGQPLAKMISAEIGTDGRTVTGTTIPSRNGKDISIPLGKNVHVADDGVTIIADMNGQVLEVNGKINVEPVYVVQGNVDIKTGNIIFLGTVIISGNVEEGFSVKAAGNIEVKGTVEKAEMDAEGDIIVHQGITGGKGAGVIRAGKSLWAKFIENSAVEAGNMVVVSDGIINSQVDAQKRIICQGKRAHIVGGRLRATEEVSAKVLGSATSGTETICEVGFDPKRKERLFQCGLTKETLEQELADIQRNLQTLLNSKKQRNTLPDDKEAYLKELTEKRQELMNTQQALNTEIAEIQEYLNSLKTRGRVSASDKVYPGVKVIIRDSREDIRNEHRAVTFIVENGLIRVTKYEEPDEEAKRGPDGHSAD
ncbi:polymerase [Spirochaetia bacterium]|nr:polymerase [Spirochaetia bacterium]